MLRFRCAASTGFTVRLAPIYAVWHENALQASLARISNTTPWTDDELTKLISAHGTRIDYLLQEVCECKKGKLFSGQNYLSAFDNFNIPKEVLVIEFTNREENGG